MSVRIYDRNGRGLAEVDADVTCAWMYNDVGKASFTLSTRDAKCRRELLDFGNLVLIEHPALPAWGGVIAGDRIWGQRDLTVQARSAEHLLSWRRGPQDLKITGTAGTIFRKILSTALDEGWLPIWEGSIYEGGTERQETLNLTKLLEEAQRVATRAGHEFVFEPEIAGGVLRFVASWRVGVSTETVQDMTLVEGHNLELASRPLVEQDNICNDLIGYGDGATWATRPTFRVVDADSAARYGVRQDAVQFDGNTRIGTLEENTRQALAERIEPRARMDLRALNVGDTWSRLRIGIRIPVRLFSVGFGGYEGSATVRGMEYDGQRVRIVMEENNDE